MRYTVLRLGIFALCLVLFNALGAKSWLGLLLAAVVSVLVSLLLLRRQREEMAAALQRRIDGRVDAAQDPAARGRFRQGVEADNEAEDR
jgi:membrane protein implicated in regulation of membrane protease activity